MRQLRLMRSVYADSSLREYKNAPRYHYTYCIPIDCFYTIYW